jgi:hypothetical protein
MFVSFGMCISTLCAAFRSLLISFDFIFLVLSWFAFYVLNVIVSIVTKSDKPIVDHLFPCLVNSASSLPAYVGFCATLGVVAVFVGSSVHRFVRASMNSTIMLEDLILLRGMTWFNSVMLGIELYLVNYPLSDTIGIVIFAALAIAPSARIFKKHGLVPDVELPSPGQVFHSQSCVSLPGAVCHSSGRDIQGYVFLRRDALVFHHVFTGTVSLRFGD